MEVFSPDCNYLDFLFDRQGNGWDIYRCDIDGSNLLHLTDMPGNEFFPSVSPDGSKVLFQHGDYGALAEIYMMNHDGSGLTQITNNTIYDGSPSFSPNGEQILFSAWDGYNYPEIFLMAPDGSNRVQLTEMSGAYWNSAPRFHPSGEKIYFQAGFNADDHLAMINPDGTGWTDITEANVFGYTEANMFFKADGSKLTCFTTEKLGYNNGGDLVLANSDGSDWTYLNDAVPDVYFYQASFHPTNDLLYLSHLPSAAGKWNIYTMMQDGSNLEPLTNCSLAGLDEGGQIVGVELSPNPAKDILTIEITGIRAVNSIEMISLTGQMLQAFEWDGNQRSQLVDISVLPDGVYFCRILGENKTVTRKLMIVR